ncbi:hypothetical protein H0H87_000894 [Tephrocybe sp. NHM501043]|nr:hypothetical protein H0H87_000894 [Tephrocybe sp. NHM501043]
MDRLESESRTLAKRISAVSLSSQDDHYISMHTDPTTGGTYTTGRDILDSPFLQSNASATRNQFQQPTPRSSLDRIPAAKSTSRPMPNSSLNSVYATPSKRKTSSPGPSPAPAFQRSRTYSQPYHSEVSTGYTPRPKTTKSSTQGNGKSARSPDVRPTRIPQPSGRSPPLSMSTHTTPNQGHVSPPPPIPNGHNQYTANSTPPQQAYTYAENGLRTPIAIPRSSSNVHVNSSVGLGLLNESPPFNPASASSSITPSHRSASPDPIPPRPSMESDERPFEHWYRGEVSRNGGVGELRVGRRQEMLEIANYGHTLRERERQRRDNGTVRRKRADSVSGIGDGSRERASLYLDDEDAQRIGQVLDEAPLTDMEASEGGHHDAQVYGYGHSDDDQGEAAFSRENEHAFDADQTHATSNEAISPQHEATSRTSHDARSTTPTPAIIQAQRPDSRNSRNTSVQPSKIPARSRQSSESRVMTPTQLVRGASETPSTPSSSQRATPPPPRQRQQQQQPKTPNGRATSKTRTPAGKARAKTLAPKKDVDEEAKRRSVAHYPTPGDDGDETMIDAIPEWTQPVPRQGNWDDVVLPVVARKKGLDAHYQKADGNTAPRPVDTTPAPAPGTFAYDGSKYRQRADGESELIPMDEFGKSNPQPATIFEDERPLPNSLYDDNINNHDLTRLPVRATAPSPAPFADYAPSSRTKVPAVTTADLEHELVSKDQLPDRDDEGGGCCKCVIM